MPCFCISVTKWDGLEMLPLDLVQLEISIRIIMHFLSGTPNAQEVACINSASNVRSNIVYQLSKYIIIKL